jgi:hypothetical protein
VYVGEVVWTKAEISETEQEFKQRQLNWNEGTILRKPEWGFRVVVGLESQSLQEEYICRIMEGCVLEEGL